MVVDRDGIWDQLATMKHERQRHASILDKRSDSGYVYVAGGVHHAHGVLRDVEAFVATDPKKFTRGYWHKLPSMNKRRESFSLLIWNRNHSDNQQALHDQKRNIMADDTPNLFKETDQLKIPDQDQEKNSISDLSLSEDIDDFIHRLAADGIADLSQLKSKCDHLNWGVLKCFKKDKIKNIFEVKNLYPYKKENSKFLVAIGGYDGEYANESIEIMDINTEEPWKLISMGLDLPRESIGAAFNNSTL